MNLKRVSYRIAKILKEVGYPQDYQRYKYNLNGDLIDLIRRGGVCYGPVAPTYVEVWFWLWREKKKHIDIVFSTDEDGWTFMQNPSPCDCGLYNDPEDAIEKAIDFLIDNLIK